MVPSAGIEPAFTDLKGQLGNQHPLFDGVNLVPLTGLEPAFLR